MLCCGLRFVMIDPRSLCSAAVVAGGKSSRMGSPKARLEFAGEPLLARVLRPLQALFEDVFIVSDDASLADFGVPVWPDVTPGGPLAGILTALEHAERHHCLVVACDMPFLSAPFLRYMTELAPDAPIVAPRDARGWHPLCAVYARSIAPTIAQAVHDGQLAIHALLDELPTRAVHTEDIEKFARPGRDPLLNLNTPEEFEAARKALQA
jgi:molybdopterin-guanine dinucleotide biosynthesis protein A